MALKVTIAEIQVLKQDATRVNDYVKQITGGAKPGGKQSPSDGGTKVVEKAAQRLDDFMSRLVGMDVIIDI
jgi:hypothetical protein